jgi:hypothetical protein
MGGFVQKVDGIFAFVTEKRGRVAKPKDRECSLIDHRQLMMVRSETVVEQEVDVISPIGQRAFCLTSCVVANDLFLPHLRVSHVAFCRVSDVTRSQIRRQHTADPTSQKNETTTTDIMTTTTTPTTLDTSIGR